MPPVALIIAGGVAALIVVVLLVWILRGRRDHAFLHVPTSAESTPSIPEILRSKAEPQPAAPEPPAEKIAEQPEPVEVARQVAEEPEPVVFEPEPEPEPVLQPEPVLEPELEPLPEPMLEPEVYQPVIASQPEAPAAPVESAPVESAPAPAFSAEPVEAAPPARPDFVMEAPVELWLGEARIGIRAGSHSHKAFLRYANELLADLKAARSDAR